MNNLLEKSQEYDLNPTIIFDQNAKVIKYNQEAEYLLSFVDTKELYELAMSYAPVNYGFKNSYINYQSNTNSYYAIQVGYEDEEFLVVKLYKEVCHKDFSIKNIETTKTSIYTLIELSLSTTLSSKKLITEYDPSITETHIRVKEMMLLLNAVFSSFKKSEEITIKVGVKLGAKLLVNDKKYTVCSIMIESKDSVLDDRKKLEQLAKDADVILFLHKSSIVMDFALVV